MRLSKIKLAGFKSFVDPITIPFPSDLVGIVGPNGCGKSNTIDAVRWVMGESSAKQLRGDSMTDVIFNGSSTRKPVGKATVELVFDNSDGTLGGEYANYAEISIKRQVTRDGQSVYFLNGARCRKRDITDVFLGTGLGPRSYAIIEQGTISRIIEARPEEMRGYLEEAAGISKYKERRKETERRIKATRENMERLDDLRDEVGKQLQKLERQSRTAERYREYKDQERQLKAELLTIRLRDLSRLSHGGERGIAEANNALEALIAEQRAVESSLEHDRQEQTEANDAHSEIQGRFYSVGADIARSEQAISHARDLRGRLEQEYDNLNAAVGEMEEHLDLDRAELEELNGFLLDHEPDLERADEAAEVAADTLADLELALGQKQSEWDEFTRRSAEPAQAAEVERSRIEQMEKAIHLSQQREMRLREESNRLDSTELERDIEDLRVEDEMVEEEQAARSEELAQVQEEITGVRDSNNRQSSELDEARRQLQEQRGRFSSLEALQQAALGQDDAELSSWLQENQLNKLPRLAQHLTPETGWETALETVLSKDLQALCVDGVDSVSEAITGLAKGSVSLIDTSTTLPAPAAGPLPRLIDKVTAPWSLEALLGGIFLSESVFDALSHRDNLQNHQSIITRDGVWVGRNWLRVSHEDDAHAGVLAREQEIKVLAGALDEGEERSEGLQAQLEQGREALHELESRRDGVQSEISEAHRRHSDLRARLSGKEARLEQIQARRARLEEDLAEILVDVSDSGEELIIAKERHADAMEQMEVLTEERELLAESREVLRERVNGARGEIRRLKDDAHHLALEVESKKVARDSLANNVQRTEVQLAQQEERRDELQDQLEDALEPMTEHSENLELLLEQRLEVEMQLAEARKRVEAVDMGMRERDQRRIDLERRSIEAREEVQRQMLAQQDTIVQERTLRAQLEEAGYHYETVFSILPEDATETVWKQRNQEVASRITRLGPINLAAIEEFKEQSERKVYLDSQQADLTEALEVLDAAIRKIDKETKSRFKDTFDKVNTRLREMFPRLFGGGEAYLELTGEDLLDTGVTVMARPPGKRLSTIHLMSGGEKALTAVALVFAIFELNPAPFCMLDEVDAPLDDANVGRFCRLVEEMSERVQFIFISHNKAAIEMARQLTGVTMREAGVSRLVAVDVDEAVEMANAS